MAEKFRGWPETALDFYRGIEADNTKAYWTDHEAGYEAGVKAPFEALSDLVAAEFGQGDDAVRTRALLRDLVADAD